MCAHSLRIGHMITVTQQSFVSEEQHKWLQDERQNKYPVTVTHVAEGIIFGLDDVNLRSILHIDTHNIERAS